MKSKWMFNLVYIIYVTLVCCIDGIPENLKLVLVQMLYRHGDRAPFHLYPNDPNPASAWPDGLGKLTQLGRQQHRNLGKFFRSYYQKFMSSDPSEILVLSTDQSRCIESAISNLASFYPFNEAVEFQQQTNDQQIPIFFVPSAYDEYLGAHVDCPRFKAEKKRNMDGELNALLKRFKEVFEFYSHYAGEDIASWKTATPFYDTLFIEKKHNLIVPEWADAYWSELEEIAEAAYNWPSSVTSRLRAGPLLKYMIKYMQAKIDGKTSIKFHAYSGHNINIVIMSKALKLNISKRVPYCATLIFELYSGQMNSHFVRILYLNSTEPENVIESPHVLMLEGCEEFCPLEYFIRYTRHLIPVDFRKECEYQPQDFQSGASMLVTGALVILIILIAVFLQKFKVICHRLVLLKHYLLHQKV